VVNIYIIPIFTFVYLLFFDFTKNTNRIDFYFVANLFVLFVLSFLVNFLALAKLTSTHHFKNLSYHSYLLTIAVTTSALFLTVMGTMIVASRIDATKKIYRVAALIAFPLYLYVTALALHKSYGYTLRPYLNF
jgi:hypothetical protein